MRHPKDADALIRFFYRHLRWCRCSGYLHCTKEKEVHDGSGGEKKGRGEDRDRGGRAHEISRFCVLVARRACRAGLAAGCSQPFPFPFPGALFLRGRGEERGCCIDVPGFVFLKGPRCISRNPISGYMRLLVEFTGGSLLDFTSGHPGLDSQNHGQNLEPWVGRWRWRGIIFYSL